MALIRILWRRKSSIYVVKADDKEQKNEELEEAPETVTQKTAQA